MMGIERRVEAEEARMLYTHTAYDGGERTPVRLAGLAYNPWLKVLLAGLV